MNGDHRSVRTTWARAVCLGVSLAVAAAVAVLLLGRAVATARALGVTDARPATPDEVLQGLAAAATGVLLLWLVAGATLTAVATAPGALGRAAERAALHLTPLAVRGAVAAVLGGVVVTGVATGVATGLGAGEHSSHGPVHTVASTSVERGADPGASPSQQPGSVTRASYRFSDDSPAAGSSRTLPDPGWSSSHLPAPGWTPERPAAPSAKPADVGLVSAAPAAGRAALEHLVVHRGDTLWAIAARHLGPQASAGEIARAWPRWYAANRAVIGPDPDLLRPGQILHPPAAERTTSRTTTSSSTTSRTTTSRSAVAKGDRP